MNIGILGTGNVGSVLGRRLAAAGHPVYFGSRQPASEKVQELMVSCSEHPVTVGTLGDAVARSEVVFLAVPYDHAPSVLQGVSEWSSKILVDCTNPLNSTFNGLQLGFTESAAERLASHAVGARVIKAFNTASVATMADPHYGEHDASMFFCGDDDEAKEKVGELIAALGMEPVDSGPLVNARYLEPLAMLYIHLAVHQGWGGNCALKVLRREKK